jgi:hypothetical protein
METKVFNIDSKTRNINKYPNSNNFKYNIFDNGQVIHPFDEKNVIELNISNIEIPNNIHFINTTKGNNTITIDSSSNTIPSGSYSKSELVDIMNDVNPGVVFSYSSTTGKISIENTTGSTINVIFTALSNGYDSLGEILGFANTTYTINNTDILESPNVMTLPQEKYIFLNINNYGNVMNGNKKYVAKIIFDNSSRFDDINQETTLKIISHKIVFRKPTNINQLTLTLCDYKDQLVNMNGSNYSITMELKIIHNTILKYYSENQFYDSEVMQQILNVRMLQYYDNQTNNNTLAGQYNTNIHQHHNNIQFDYDGVRNNYWKK